MMLAGTATATARTHASATAAATPTHATAATATAAAEATAAATAATESAAAASATAAATAGREIGRLACRRIYRGILRYAGNWRRARADRRRNKYRQRNGHEAGRQKPTRGPGHQSSLSGRAPRRIDEPRAGCVLRLADFAGRAKPDARGRRASEIGRPALKKA